MDIQKLLNVLDEKVVRYLPDVDEIIQDYFPTKAYNALVNKNESEMLPINEYYLKLIDLLPLTPRTNF